MFIATSPLQVESVIMKLRNMPHELRFTLDHNLAYCGGMTTSGLCSVICATVFGDIEESESGFHLSLANVKEVISDLKQWLSGWLAGWRAELDASWITPLKQLCMSNTNKTLLLQNDTSLPLLLEALFLDPKHMRKDITDAGGGLKADKKAIQMQATECLRQLAVWIDPAGRALLEKDPAAMAALRSLSTIQGKALTEECRQAAEETLLSIVAITSDLGVFEKPLKAFVVGTKDERQAAYTQVAELLDGHSADKVKLAKACVAPLVHGVLCADTSRVDAAEARRAYMVLGKLVHLDPL